MTPIAKSIRLTQRDLEILQFINHCGFCEMTHLNKFFTLKKPRNYQVMRRLVNANLVIHERILHGRHGIYRLSTKGAEGMDLPPLAKVVLGSYYHDVMLTDLIIYLRRLHPETEWISERRLRRDKHIDGVGKAGHLPDSLLAFPDGGRVAIELELTHKGKKRLEQILKGYSAQFDLKEVWYYCIDSLVVPLKEMTSKMPFIKIFSLKDFIT